MIRLQEGKTMAMVEAGGIVRGKTTIAAVDEPLACGFALSERISREVIG